MKITPRKYAQALAQTLESAEDPKEIIRNLLTFLRRRKQFRLLPKILQAFEEEWSRRRGIVRMRVTYPTRFAQSLEELKEYLEKAIGKTIEMTDGPSDSILGGFRVQIDDTLIDASLETRLKALEYRLNS